MISKAAAVHKFSDLKLLPCTQSKGAGDGESGNEVREVQWQKIHNNPEAWGCSFVSHQVCQVSATVRYHLLPEYAFGSQVKKREEMARVSVAPGENSSVTTIFFMLNIYADFI